jgi:glutathione S-transferase
MSPASQKVLIALHETDTHFVLKLTDLNGRAARESLALLWPMGTLPVLEDARRRVTVPEASNIIEYLNLYYPGQVRLLPINPVSAWEARALDGFFGNHLYAPLQKIFADRLSPPGCADPYGVSQARAQLQAALELLDREMARKCWGAGEFGIADCAAAPALWYAGLFLPLVRRYPNVAAYLERLQKRPSVARVMIEAEPYRELALA